MGLVLVVVIWVHRAPYAAASDAGPLAANVIRSAVDLNWRLQSVTREENPMYHDLIAAFHRKTGIPVILNTSFNENEPIVCTPEEAIDCFRRTRMDVLAIGPFLVAKPKGEEAASAASSVKTSATL